MAKLDETLHKLRQSKLNAVANHLAEAIATEHTNHQRFLWLMNHLIDLETEQRWKQAAYQRGKNSKIMDKYTLSDFDFHPSLKKNRSRILQLLECDFIAAKQDLIFIGNPGTGKTRLAKTIAYQACMKKNGCYLPPPSL